MKASKKRGETIDSGMCGTEGQPRKGIPPLPHLLLTIYDKNETSTSFKHEIEK
jgi:hypothetical protein